MGTIKVKELKFALILRIREVIFVEEVLSKL